MTDLIDYHLTDRYGVYSRTVQIDPMEPLPAGRGTITEPPQVSTGEVAVLRGGVWQVKPEAEAYPPAPDPADLLAQRKAQLREALAHRRWEAETAGITVGNGAIATDRESQAMITGAFTRAQDKLAQGQTEDTIRFKGMTGWVELDIPTTMAIGRAVGDHVQACFAREHALDTQIEAATDDAALDAIDIETGWPGQ